MEQNSEDAPTRAKRPKINTNTTSASTQEQMNKDIQSVRMYCMNLRPPSILEDGYKELVKNISNYTLPSNDRFSQELIPEEFNRASSDLIKTLDAVHHVAISIETWRWGVRGIRNMLTATAHFVHQSKLVSQTLFTLVLLELSSKDNIASAIKEEFIKWKILKKVVCIITSSPVNKKHPAIKAAIKNVLKIPLMPCITDTLNNIFQISTSDLDFDGIEICNGLHDTLFKRKKDVPYSWHDQFTMLKYYINKNKRGHFSPGERTALHECFQMLKPFEDLNNKLSSVPYLPVSFINPLFVGLSLRISKCVPTTSMGKKLKDKLNSNLCNGSHMNQFSIQATFMDPRFKVTLKKKVKQAGILKELEEKLNNENINSYNQHNPVPSTSTNNKSEDNINLLDYLTVTHEDVVDTSSLAKSVVSHYVHVPDLHPDADPFQFWEDFNRISKCNPFFIMSQKYLCIPANATPVEPITGDFPWKKSVRNNIDFQERRKLLDYENVNKILFLHSYYSRIPEINN